MRKILVHPGGTTWSGFLPGDADQVLTSGDDGPRLRFRQVGKEVEFGVHQQAAAPLPERQCVFEHWPDQLKRRSFIRVDACEPFSSARGMAGVHKNTKGLRCPSFRSLTKSLDTCLGSRHGTSRSRILQSRRPASRASPPKLGNSSPRQCPGRRQTGVVGGRFQDGTPENATS